MSPTLLLPRNSRQESLLKCSVSYPQLFISVIDFDMKETDDSSHILITVIDEMGRPEETKRFDRKTSDDFGKWIQVGYLKIMNGMVVHDI